MINSQYIPVEGNPSLVRDKRSGAIINVNQNEATNARERKARWRREQQELHDLRNDVKDLKNLVAKLIEDKDGGNSN